MDNLATRLAEFEWTYGDWYEISDQYNYMSELVRDIKDALRQRKCDEILADLAEHMESDNGEEIDDAMQLWNEVRAFIAKGE